MANLSVVAQQLSGIGLARQMSSGGGENIQKGYMIAINPVTDVPIVPPVIYKFIFNPNKKTDKKDVNYVVTKIPGENRPLIYYSSGGERNIEFTLLVDSYCVQKATWGRLISRILPTTTTTSGSGFISEYLDQIPGFGGIQPELAVLKSFLYPNIWDYSKQVGDWVKKQVIVSQPYTGTTFPKRSTKSLSDTTESANKDKHRIDADQFNPPPGCLFGWGASILKCIVRRVEVTEILWNRNLDPVRAEVGITLLVDERSSWSKYEQYFRRILTMRPLI